MKKLLFLFAIFTFCFAFSQNSNSKNIVLGEKRSKAFILGDKTYKWSEYQQVFKKPEALQLIKKSRTNKTVGDIFAFTGGFGMGYSLGYILTTPKESTTSSPLGGEITFKRNFSDFWTAFGISAGVSLLSIPFYIAYNKNAEKAVSIENGESTVFQPYFKFETTGNGIALSYNF